jgi:ubiquinone/menaquinone biosynthesis C-methylase UbiE
MEYSYFDEVYSSLRASGASGWSCYDAVEFFNSLTANALEEYPNMKKGFALELGCGTGEGTLYLARSGFDVIGIDFSQSAIRWAREKAQREGSSARFMVDDARYLTSFSDGSFDLIIDASCFHCIIDCDDRKSLLENVLRVLKPGGLTIFRSVCGEFTGGEKSQYYDERSKAVKRVQGRGNNQENFLHYYQGDSNDIVQEITRAGLF